MIKRSQLEAQIIDALARISPEDMQRVAEDYARIRYPVRFPRFDFRAFSAEGKSRPGWPDAWVCVDGRIDGVEATIDKAKSRVEAHLKEDLEKAANHVPPLSGLIIVSGCPTVNLTADEITAWRQRFITEAGIDAQRVDLIFGGGLVAELVRPEFARTRIEVLGLRDAPVHFKLIRARHGPDERRLDSAFIPSEQDYAARRVHRTDAADQVLALLAREGRALVRGVGASGKTVLAWLLGLEATERRLPAYYLDLAGYGETGAGIANALTADLHRFAHPDSLFVLDNCHLDEPLAKEVALNWEELSRDQRPRLLLVGRELRTTRGSAIDGLSISTIPLRARQAEVLGVYRRLAGRYARSASPPDPPPEVLDSWVRTFGGDPVAPDTTTDLIAFSAAVLGQMQRLRRGNWALDASHAVAEVREAYLDKLSEGETHNLLRLCAFQQIELALGEQALANRQEGLRKSTRKLGLVFRYRVGASGNWIRYRLAHAALENLIVASAPEPFDRASERRDAALQNPHTGLAMIGRLLAVGLHDEARELAGHMLSRPECLPETGSLLYLHLFFRRLRRLGLTFPPGLGTVLTSGATRDRLTNQALETPLHFLVSFLRYVARTTALKKVFTSLAEDLGTQKNRERLADRAVDTPLHLLASFLRYVATTTALREVFFSLAEDLGTQKNRERMTERAMETSLGDLANFLGYAAKTKELETVFSNLTEDLGSEKNRERLTERAMETSLGDLANFLGYAAKTKELETVFSNLTEDLGSEKNRERLTKRAMETSLGDLANFLGYAAKTKELETVFSNLTEDLGSEKNRERLTERAMETSLGDLANFLGYAAKTKELETVFSNLTDDLGSEKNRERMTERAMETSLGDLANFLGYAAKTKELETVFSNLTEDLGSEKNRERLTERAMETSLDDLANFLGYAAKTKELETVFSNLTDDLGSEKNCARLTERALETPLGDLANFLNLASKIRNLQPIYTSVTEYLAQPENLKLLAAAMEQQPLDAVVGILRLNVANELWDAVFAAIDVDRWTKARSLEIIPSLDAFVAFQSIAVQKERQELTEGPALRIVEGSIPDDWHRSGIGLHHLSHVLRHTSGLSFVDIEVFLDGVATREWVDELLESVPAGGLAGNLLALASTLQPGRRKWFLRETLRERVRRELSSERMYDAESRAQAISLLGSTAALGISFPITHADWPDSEELTEVLELRDPDVERETLGHLQVQLWLGLREMARMRADHVIVPSRYGDRILDLWVATKDGKFGSGLPPHVRSLNEEMVAWLLRCRAADWCLVSP